MISVALWWSVQAHSMALREASGVCLQFLTQTPPIVSNLATTGFCAFGIGRNQNRLHSFLSVQPRCAAVVVSKSSFHIKHCHVPYRLALQHLTLRPVKGALCISCNRPGSKEHGWLDLNSWMIAFIIVVVVGGGKGLGFRRARNLAYPARRVRVPGTPVCTNSFIKSIKGIIFALNPLALNNVLHGRNSRLSELS